MTRVRTVADLGAEHVGCVIRVGREVWPAGAAQRRAPRSRQYLLHYPPAAVTSTGQVALIDEATDGVVWAATRRLYRPGTPCKIVGLK